MWMITWKHQHTELSNADIDKKIELFYHQTWGWQIHPAELFINGGPDHDGTGRIEKVPHSGYACLQILLSYFEMIARYREGNLGKEQSREFFVKGVRFVFPKIDIYPYHATSEFLGTLYSAVRCGLCHMSMTGRGVVISGNGPVIVYSQDGKSIHLNPHKLPEALKLNLEHYCEMLRDKTQTELRANFEKRFDKDHVVET